MEFALVDSIIFLPPILIAGLVALYRNNILCFWDCHPAGRAVVQSLHTLKSTALMIRNTASAVMLAVKSSVALVVKAIRSTALMIFETVTGSLVAVKTVIEAFALQVVATIQRILVTIAESLETVKTFFFTLFENLRLKSVSLGNSTVAFWNSLLKRNEASGGSKLYPYIGLAVAIAVILLTWYYLSKNRIPLESKQDSNKEIVKEESKTEKKPIRRKNRKA